MAYRDMRSWKWRPLVREVIRRNWSTRPWLCVKTIFWFEVLKWRERQATEAAK